MTIIAGYVQGVGWRVISIAKEVPRRPLYESIHSRIRKRIVYYLKTELRLTSPESPMTISAWRGSKSVIG
jgi:hypothetical protein